MDVYVIKLYRRIRKSYKWIAVTFLRVRVGTDEKGHKWVFKGTGEVD